MTAVTARVAGVSRVIVASPRPAAITVGAAYVAGADAMLAVGGAQAIAALAYGMWVCNIITIVVCTGHETRFLTSHLALLQNLCMCACRHWQRSIMRCDCWARQPLGDCR